MYIIKTVSKLNILKSVKSPQYLNSNHNTLFYIKNNKFNSSSVRYYNYLNLKIKEEVQSSTPITNNKNLDLPNLTKFLKILVLTNRREEAFDLWQSFVKCNIKIDPLTSCIVFVETKNSKLTIPDISGKLMKFSSIYGNNALLNNICNKHKIEDNWKLYQKFKRIGYKVDIPLHLYLISQLCYNPSTNWEILKICINNLLNCEDYKKSNNTKKGGLSTNLINLWIKILIETERFDIVSLLIEDTKPKFNLRTYQLIIYAQSNLNCNLFPNFDMLSILQKFQKSTNFKLTAPLATRILTYLHNQNLHSEFLNWLELIRVKGIRIPKVTFNKIIWELDQNQYYMVNLKIWEILIKYEAGDPFNNHLLTTILNSFSKSNLPQAEVILTNIIEILKQKNIPLSTSIFNILMKYSNLKNQPHLTDLYFGQIQENNLKLNAYSYNLMIQKSYKLNDFNTIEGIWELCKTNWFLPNNLTWIWFLDIYLKLGNWERLEEILDLIRFDLINNSDKLRNKVNLVRDKLDGINNKNNN